MISPDTTIKEIFDILNETNAASLRLVLGNDKSPKAAIVAVMGDPETREIIEAVDYVEEDWNQE